MPATLQVVCVPCSKQKVCYAKLRSSSREGIAVELEHFRLIA